MLIGTHTLLPVCTCLVADNLSVVAGRGRIYQTRSLCAVAVFGVLPDLCTPHLSLDARYASWSHTLWFAAAIIVAAAITGSFFAKGSRVAVALACWFAAALHLATDAVSGGIAWLYPWRDDVIGDYDIEPANWLWFDIGFVLLTWFLLRLLPHLEARHIRACHTAQTYPVDH